MDTNKILRTCSAEHLYLRNTFQVCVKCSRQKRPQAKVRLRMKTVISTSTTTFSILVYLQKQPHVYSFGIGAAFVLGGSKQPSVNPRKIIDSVEKMVWYG